MKDKSRRIMRILLQLIFMVAIIGGLLWYVGISSLVTALSHIKLEYLPPAFLAYFGINLLFAVRLRRVLKREGVKASLGKTLLAQYAGMLTSDVTPGRSGYFLTPAYLRDQDVPTSVSLSGILGIQTIEFLFKVFGGVLALIFLVETVDLLAVNRTLFILSSLGVALMLVGAVFLAALSWSQRVISLFNRIVNSRLKDQLSLNRHHVRSFKRITIHALLCIIAMLLAALVALRLNRPEKARSIALLAC